MDSLKEYLDGLLSEQEHAELEFKHAHGGFPGSFWETYSAFANTNGGLIVFGAKEKNDQLASGIGRGTHYKLFKFLIWHFISELMIDFNHRTTQNRPLAATERSQNFFIVNGFRTFIPKGIRRVTERRTHQSFRGKATEAVCASSDFRKEISGL